MTRMDARYHVLDGRPDTPKKEQLFWENLAAQ